MLEVAVMAEHIVSRTIYFGIFGALIVLTFATVLVAKIDLGQWNVVVALAIAVTKAMLVILYFMHIKYSKKLTQVVVVAGFLWLLLLLGLTLSDYLTRGWFNLPGIR
jgi:cytochrome c oxidase subunit 4